MMRASVESVILLMAAALVAAPAAGQGQEEQEEEERDVVEERIRTVTVQPDDGALFVAGPPRGWLGVRVDDLDGAAADSLGLDRVRGARVLGVDDDSPAARAGLGEDDVIVGFDGASVRSVAELVRLVRETPPDREVELEVVRDGSPRTVGVTVGERTVGVVGSGGLPGLHRLEIRGPGDLPEGLSEERMERIRERMERAGDGRADAMRRLHEHMSRLRDGDGFRFHVGAGPRLGIRVESLTDQLAGYFGVEDRGGALVSSVEEGSPAAAADLRAGDVVVSFGGEEVEDVGELMKAVHDAEAGPVTVTVVRRGDERTLTVELPEHRREGRSGRGPASWTGDAPGPGQAVGRVPPASAPPAVPVSPSSPAPPAVPEVGPEPSPVPPPPAVAAPAPGTFIL